MINFMCQIGSAMVPSCLVKHEIKYCYEVFWRHDYHLKSVGLIQSLEDLKSKH